MKAFGIKSFLAFIFILLSVSVFGSGSKDTSLVARFFFIDGDLQSSALELKAKAVGLSLVEDRFGNSNSAYYLHGSPGSYLNLGTCDKLKPLKGTVSIWFKVDNIVSSGRGATFNPIMLTKSHGGDDFFEGYSLLCDIATRRFGVSTTFDEGNQVTIRTADTLVCGDWYHLVFTYNDDFLTLYVNGVFENKMAKNFTSRFLQGDSVMIGNSANYKNERYFNGVIDDIEIYDRVLTPAEVVQLYNAPNPNKFAAYKKITLYATGIIVIIILIIWLSIKSYKRSIARKQAAIDVANRLMELETKSIRTQMNPHFIFNSLNTLNRFILEADLANAEIYLAKFAKLLRKLMESSTSDKISLAEEIEILQGYLEIEKLRFTNSFDFNIDCNIDRSSELFMPFMLVQPFVENAVWHGLIPKKDTKFVSISFMKLDQNRIECIIEDNGVGREEAQKHKDPLKKRSLAMDFIKQRLDLIARSKGIECYFEIIDKKDTASNSLGTKVVLIIPILN